MFAGKQRLVPSSLVSWLSNSWPVGFAYIPVHRKTSTDATIFGGIIIDKPLLLVQLQDFPNKQDDCHTPINYYRQLHCFRIMNIIDVENGRISMYQAHALLFMIRVDASNSFRNHKAQSHDQICSYKPTCLFSKNFKNGWKSYLRLSRQSTYSTQLVTG